MMDINRKDRGLLQDCMNPEIPARGSRTISRSRCGKTASATEQEISMSSKKTLIAISAIALGIVGAASVAQANDSGENNKGGYVVPGSVAAANPAYHPRRLVRAGNASRYA